MPGKIRILDLGTVPQMREKIARLPGPPRNLERHCPAWGVRGHYRHYKDGRCVYVRPCVKGPDRSQYRGREYELLVRRGYTPEDAMLYYVEKLEGRHDA